MNAKKDSKFSFGDLVDTTEIQKLSYLIHELIKFPSAIIDVDNNILVASGWQDICTKFHRINKESCKKCFESDHFISNHLTEERYVEYKCKNGLWDVAYPIIIEGQHLATIFTGQFFYKGEQPDRDYFIKQAEKYGFPKDEYLEALDRVPYFTRDQIKKIMDLNVKLANILSAQGLVNLKLKREVEARKQTVKELRESQKKLNEANQELESRVEERTMELSIANKELKHEIDARMKMEEKIIQSEKMISVGGLASGMAHEINNPLAAIIQGTQNVLRRISPSIGKNKDIAAKVGINLEALESYFQAREIDAFLVGIKDAGVRAAKIVKNLMDISHINKEDLVNENINELIDDSITRCLDDFDVIDKYNLSNIEIVKQYDSSLPEIKCIKSEIEHVILNLLKNGAEMMLEISQSEQSQLEGYQPTFYVRTYQKNDHLYIEIEDNGPGMDEATRKRIFEPFYTTKPVGKGIGLGLSVSYFIITQNHNGNMWVESVDGKGAKFVIELPVRS